VIQELLLLRRMAIHLLTSAYASILQDASAYVSSKNIRISLKKMLVILLSVLNEIFK
jgi:hypothetical protein